MKAQNTDIEFLITAYAYSFSSLNESFYLRKRDLKVIGVHMFDYSLVSEYDSEYESGLSKEVERDIKEAIIAIEKGYDTHVSIPRLTKEQRFEIMAEFIGIGSKYRAQLLSNRDTLLESAENYGMRFFKKGIKPGVDMEYLSHGIDDDLIKSGWTEFYRSKTKAIALNWLEAEKVNFQHGEK